MFSLIIFMRNIYKKTDNQDAQKQQNLSKHLKNQHFSYLNTSASISLLSFVSLQHLEILSSDDVPSSNLTCPSIGQMSRTQPEYLFKI